MGTRAYKRLTDRFVKNAKPGSYCDGQGLWLHVSDSGAKKWILRFSFNRRVHEMGLGNAHDVWLADARVKAEAARRLAASGVNPITARREDRAAARAAEAAKTFGECADALIASKRSGWRSAVHAQQWERTLRDHCMPIWDMPVDAIDTKAVLSVLTPHWQRVPETASRLRGRIEATLDYAKANGWRTGENPAAWRNHLALILPERKRLERAHLIAVPYQDVPEFIAKLRETESVAARALEFLILAAARSNEVLGMQWVEVDLESRVWTVPGTRMKAGISHRVPLSGRAMELLESIKHAERGGHLLVFPRPGRRPRPLASWAMASFVESATVHGFRSSFRDWCAEVAQAPREIAEACLAHATGSAVERAYLRTDVLERRRTLLESWARFCGGTQADNATQLLNRAG
jgi:integrase